MTVAAKIMDEYRRDPDRKAGEIARAVGCREAYVRATLSRQGIVTGRQRRYSRDEDELLIEAIRKKRAGLNWPEVLRATGIASSSCHSVLKADLAESGEAQASVRGAYW